MHQYIFQLLDVTSSMLHIPAVGWTRRTCYLMSTLQDLITLNFFFQCHMKSLSYGTLVAKADNLPAWIVVTLVVIASISNLFQQVQQSFVPRYPHNYDIRGYNLE
ncbi:hypothetical protein TNCV_2044231 [Trichonephila clavipes]|nr:hypothetical protein TNCV_2044231 [Trichonephila clavipes]